MQQENRSSLERYFAAEIQLVAAILMLTSVIDVQEGTDETQVRPIHNRPHHPRVRIQLQRLEEAEATNSSPIRCQSPQLRKTTCRMTHPKRSDTREQFHPWQLRRGVLPTRSWPTLAKPSLAKISRLCLWLVSVGVGCSVLLCVLFCCVLMFPFFLSTCLFGSCRGTPPPPRTTPPDPPSPGPPHRWTAQNFALFFPSPATNFALFVSHCCVFSLNFGGV